jgi:hypothetical protein
VARNRDFNAALIPIALAVNRSGKFTRAPAVRIRRKGKPAVVTGDRSDKSPVMVAMLVVTHVRGGCLCVVFACKLVRSSKYENGVVKIVGGLNEQSPKRL